MKAKSLPPTAKLFVLCSLLEYFFISADRGADFHEHFQLQQEHTMLLFGQKVHHLIICI